MGWLTMHETRTAKQVFLDMYKDEPNFEIVDIAIKNFRTAYIAVKNLERGYIFCQTYMIHRAPKSYYNFGYKPVSEFMGPTNDDCPKKILDKLTPLNKIARMDNFGESSIEWAKNWRERCYKNIENSNKLSKGGIIKLNQPINFTNGAIYQYFKKEGKQIFAIVNYGTREERYTRVRISRFNTLEYSFVGETL